MPRFSAANITDRPEAPQRPQSPGPIAVCICTCNREQGLAQALEGIARQSYQDDVSVVVVDNHKAQLGIELALETSKNYPLPLTALFEPQRGIAYARNTAVRAAISQGAKLVAFIDDDEVPTATWLEELVRTHLETDADIVGGPVSPTFRGDAPRWAIRSGFYAQRRPVYRGELLLNSTANVLIRTKRLAEQGETPFNLEFGLTGGSDQVLFWQMSKGGCSMAWAADALVHEEVPESRLSDEWVLQRVYRNGNINVRAQRMFEPGLLMETKRLAKTLGLFLVGSAHLLLAGGRHERAITGKIMLSKARGKLAAHFGRHYAEYAIRHT